MDITLPPHIGQRITELVEGGYYASPAAAIQAGLDELERKMEYDERLAELRDEIDIGLADIEAGRCRPLSGDALRELMLRAADEAAAADRSAAR